MTSLTFDTGSETLSLSLPVLTPDALNAVEPVPSWRRRLSTWHVAPSLTSSR